MLDSPTVCPSPVTKYGEIPARLQQISNLIEVGGTWWFVIPNQLAEKLYSNEQVRFVPSVRELPGSAYSKISAHVDSIEAVAKSVAGEEFSVNEIWSVAGYLASPSSLTCIAGDREGQTTTSYNDGLLNLPLDGLEALQTQAHIGPSATSALNAGWLVKATRTSADVRQMSPGAFSSRSFADELHFYIHNDQVVDAGRILKAYYEQVIVPEFAGNNENASDINRREFNQKLVVHTSMGLAKSITSLEDVSLLIRPDAFERTIIDGDLPSISCTREWPEIEGFIHPRDSGITPQTYLAIELKLFLSRWVFPNPPLWIRGNLNDRQLIDHLLGLCGILEREINWVEIDRLVSALPFVLSYPRGLEINGIGGNLAWITGKYIDDEAHRAYTRKIWDLKRLVVRWRRRVILNRAKSMGVDETKFVLAYRKVTRTGPKPAPKVK